MRAALALLIGVLFCGELFAAPSLVKECEVGAIDTEEPVIKYFPLTQDCPPLGVKTPVDTITTTTALCRIFAPRAGTVYCAAVPHSSGSPYGPPWPTYKQLIAGEVPGGFHCTNTTAGHELTGCQIVGLTAETEYATFVTIDTNLYHADGIVRGPESFETDPVVVVGTPVPVVQSAWESLASGAAITLNGSGGSDDWAAPVADDLLVCSVAQKRAANTQSSEMDLPSGFNTAGCYQSTGGVGTPVAGNFALVASSDSSTAGTVSGAFDAGTGLTDAVLQVAIIFEQGPAPNTKSIFPGCTYDGVSIPYDFAAAYGPPADTTSERIETFVLVDPSEGSNTLACEFNNSTNDNVVSIFARVLENVNQTTPVGALTRHTWKSYDDSDTFILPFQKQQAGSFVSFVAAADSGNASFDDISGLDSSQGYTLGTTGGHSILTGLISSGLDMTSAQNLFVSADMSTAVPAALNTSGAWTGLAGATGNTAVKLIPNTSNTAHTLTSSFAGRIPPKRIQLNFDVKAAEYTALRARMHTVISGTTNQVTVDVDLSDVSFEEDTEGTSIVADAVESVTITAVGGGWRRVAVVMGTGNASANWQIEFSPLSGGTNVFAGDDSSGILLDNVSVNLLDIDTITKYLTYSNNAPVSAGTENVAFLQEFLPATAGSSAEDLEHCVYWKKAEASDTSIIFDGDSGGVAAKTAQCTEYSASNHDLSALVHVDSDFSNVANASSASQAAGSIAPPIDALAVAVLAAETYSGWASSLAVDGGYTLQTAADPSNTGRPGAWTASRFVANTSGQEPSFSTSGSGRSAGTVLAFKKKTVDPPVIINPDIYTTSGLLIVSEDTYDVDPTCTTDSQPGFQQAYEDAWNQQKIMFIMPGCYLFHDTLSIEKRSVTGRLESVAIQGSTVGDGVTIRLKNNATGYDNTPTDDDSDWYESKPIVHIWGRPKDEPPGLYTDCGVNTGTPKKPLWPNRDPNNCEWDANHYNTFIRDIAIECGSGNPGAVGLRFAAAQTASIEDVSIDCTGGWAGVFDLPGVGWGAVNLTVIGGYYGVYTNQGAGGILINTRLINQGAGGALHWRGQSPMMMTGCEIVKANSPAITLESGNGSHYHSLGMYDCSVEITGDGSEPVIDNTIGKMFYAKNLYIKQPGAGGLVKNKSATIAKLAGGAWTKLETAYTTDTPGTSNIAFAEVSSYYNGAVVAAGVLERKSLESPPANLRSKYYMDIPSIEDPGVVDASKIQTSAGFIDGSDSQSDLAALQEIVNDYDNIVLPKGTFRIKNGTLLLGENTTLFGVARHLTRILPTNDWQPTSPVWMIQTVNSATATTRLANIYFAPHKPPCLVDCRDYEDPISPYDFVSTLNWRAGVNSATYGLQQHTFESDLRTYTQATRKGFVLFSDNAGGRHYHLEMDNHAHTGGEQVRSIGVDGTSNPLWIIGIGKQDAKKPGVPIRVTNSSNVRLIGQVGQEGHMCARIQDSDNVAFYGCGNSPSPTVNQAAVEFHNSTNVAAALVGAKKKWPGGVAVFRRNGSGVTTYSSVTTEHITFFEDGTLDDDTMQAALGIDEE